MALSIPSSIAGKADIIRVQREIERLVDERLQSKVAEREVGQPRSLSKPSAILNELLAANQIKPDDQTLQELPKLLHQLHENAPRVRVSLVVEPEEDVRRQIVGWFREQVDPYVLVQIGIQPSIAAGCVIQTPKNRYDFSVRSRLLGSENVFMEVMKRGQ